ncbi:DUF4157 domain-containing protein [Nocardia sp. NPDC049149]|uniref:eCIS core domain-containing protein n=1 Tax=Nocardia sp. NPDC049149 TaxID=3364315 RepID=UPI00371551CB
MSTPATRHSTEARVLRQPPAPRESVRGDEQDTNTTGFGVDVTAVPAAGAPLDPTVRTRMEASFGQDFSAVRTHTGPAADTSARSQRARAYAVGNDLVFRDGAFQPGTPAGDHLLVHELAHVVQQGPTRSGGDPSAMEHDADRAADSWASAGAIRVTGQSPVRIACQDEDKAFGPPTLAQQRAQDYMESDPTFQFLTWNTRFRKGFESAAVDAAAAAAITAAMNNSSDVKFGIGFGVGVPAGVLGDLWGQVKGLALLGWQAAKLFVKYKLDPVGLLIETKQTAQQLADLALRTLAGAEPLGKAAGEYLSGRLTTLAKASPYDQGFAIGEAVGYLVAEIALLFIGVEEVSAAARALSATELGARVAKIVEGSRVLKALAEAKGLKKAESAGKAAAESHAPKVPEAGAAPKAPEPAPKMVEPAPAPKSVEPAPAPKPVEPTPAPKPAEPAPKPAEPTPAPNPPVPQSSSVAREAARQAIIGAPHKGSGEGVEAAAMAVEAVSKPVFDVNPLTGNARNFPAIDYLTREGAVSVKSHDVGKELTEAGMKAYVKDLDVLRYGGEPGVAQVKTQKAGELIAKNRAAVQQSGAWPANLPADASAEAITAEITRNGIIKIPDEHVPPMRAYIEKVAKDNPNYAGESIEHLKQRFQPSGITAAEVADIHAKVMAELAK